MNKIRQRKNYDYNHRPNSITSSMVSFNLNPSIDICYSTTSKEKIPKSSKCRDVIYIHSRDLRCNIFRKIIETIKNTDSKEFNSRISNILQKNYFVDCMEIPTNFLLQCDCCFDVYLALISKEKVLLHLNLKLLNNVNNEIIDPQKIIYTHIEIKIYR